MTAADQDTGDPDPRHLRARIAGTLPILLVQIAWIVVWYLPAAKTFLFSFAAAQPDPPTIVFTVVRSLFFILAALICPGLLFSVWQNVRRATDGLVAAAAGAALLIGVSLVGRFLGLGVGA